jgi:WD40 repeat protein
VLVQKLCAWGIRSLMLLAMLATVTNARPVPPSDRPPYVVGAAFSPDNKYILAIYLQVGGRAGNHQWAALLDAATGKELRRMFESGLVHPIIFLPDSKHILGPDSKHRPAPDDTAGAENTLVLWEIPSGKRVRSFVSQELWFGCSLAVSPDHKVLLSGHREDGRILVWDIATGKQVRAFDTEKPPARLSKYDVQFLLFSADAKQVFAVSPGTIKLWDLATGRQVPRSFAEYEKKSNINHFMICQSPDGQLACSGCCGYERADPMLKVRDLNNGK